MLTRSTNSLAHLSIKTLIRQRHRIPPTLPPIHSKDFDPSKYPFRRGSRSTSRGRRRTIDELIRTSDFDSKQYALAPVELSPIEEPPTQQMEIPYPKDIVAFLDQYVVGQQLAKKTLAVGVYQHYKRVDYNIAQQERAFLQSVLQETVERKQRKKPKTDSMNFELSTIKTSSKSGFSKDNNEIVLDKSNIVLLGPSGSGKTYLTQKLAEALNVPFAMCDCTTLTQAGYVGDDVESVVQKLIANCNGDVQKAEQGIVFLDEFDKIYTSSDPIHTGGNRDVSGKGVQQALLKLVEGTRVIVKHPLQANTKIEVDTTNILFVASGAFSNLERLIARRLDHRSLGFCSQSTGGESLREDLDAEDEKIVSNSKSALLTKADHGDLISFGMVPELVGRFPVLVPFHALTEDMLKQILTEPKNNIVDQSKKLFSLDGINLEFTQCALQELASMAVKRKTGARALRSIMEKVLLDAKYDCPGSLKGTVSITAAVVRGETPYEKVSQRNVVTTEDKNKH